MVIRPMQGKYVAFCWRVRMDKDSPVRWLTLVAKDLPSPGKEGVPIRCLPWSFDQCRERGGARWGYAWRGYDLMNPVSDKTDSNSDAFHCFRACATR